MKKNERTTVDNLQVGDRFYFQNDKNKVVWELISHDEKTTKYRTYRHFCLLGTYADRVQDPVMRKNNSKGIMPTTQVVYLRSTKEVSA